VSTALKRAQRHRCDPKRLQGPLVALVEQHEAEDDADGERRHQDDQVAHDEAVVRCQLEPPMGLQPEAQGHKAEAEEERGQERHGRNDKQEGVAPDQPQVVGAEAQDARERAHG
jgi:hypothetical protein